MYHGCSYDLVEGEGMRAGVGICGYPTAPPISDQIMNCVNCEVR